MRCDYYAGGRCNPRATGSSSNAQSGGGILSWLGCHYIDMIRYVTGDEVVAVSAEVATRSGEAIDVEDVAILSLRFRSGAVGSLHAGYMLALSGSGYHNKAGYDTYGGFSGQLGRITWSSPSSPSKITAESIHPAWASAPQRVFDMPPAESPAYGGVSGRHFMRGFIRAGRGEAWTSGRGRRAIRVSASSIPPTGKTALADGLRLPPVNWRM